MAKGGCDLHKSAYCTGSRGIDEHNSSQDPKILKLLVQQYWDNHPCEACFGPDPTGSPEFFQTLDERRYRIHHWLPKAARFSQAEGLRVLEIGCGCGADAERFASNGAKYTGVDISSAAVEICKKRFALANLEACLIQADTEELPFAENSFDFVYSHGVLHHTPDTRSAIREIFRVLVPGGELAVMLYHRNSFHYLVNVLVLLRVRALLLMSDLGSEIATRIWHERIENIAIHRELARRDLQTYLETKNMLNRNTDGPDNPLSQVFSSDSAYELFSDFIGVGTEVKYWSQSWLPVIGKLVPLSIEEWLTTHWGWHLWIYGKKPRPGSAQFNPRLPSKSEDLETGAYRLAPDFSVPRRSIT